MVRQQGIQKQARPRTPGCATDWAAYVADLVLIVVFVWCARCASGNSKTQVAHPKKSFCFQGAPVRHQISPLRGVCRGRANTPSGEGAAQFLADPLDAESELRLTHPCDMHRRQDRAAHPQHGLQPRSPTMTDHPRLWTEPEIELLRAEWAAGRSCREIAAKLPGRTRMAVAGMAARLGLPVRRETLRSFRSGKRTLVKRQVMLAGARSWDYEPAPITLAGPEWSRRAA